MVGNDLLPQVMYFVACSNQPNLVVDVESIMVIFARCVLILLNVDYSKSKFHGFLEVLR